MRQQSTKQHVALSKNIGFVRFYDYDSFALKHCRAICVRLPLLSTAMFGCLAVCPIAAVGLGQTCYICSRYASDKT